MRRIWKRLRRLWSQSRIRLPRRSLGPADLRRGDRLEIGTGVFRVRGSVVFRSSVQVFALDELNGGPERRPVRLLVPPGGGKTWVLVAGGERVGVPVEGVGWYGVDATPPWIEIQGYRRWSLRDRGKTVGCYDSRTYVVEK